MGYLYLTGTDRPVAAVDQRRHPSGRHGTVIKFTIERTNMGYQEFTIEARNAVIEAYRSGKPIDKLFILDGCQGRSDDDHQKRSKKHDTLVKYVTKERLDQLSETGKHQGVIAYAAAYEYAEVDDILEAAKKKG